MLDVILESTDETVNEEVLWKVSSATLHECHPLFIGIDVIVHRGELFQLL
jgi:tartrate dehydratase alpha subunit/fumarate hydratase class I-like protein